MSQNNQSQFELFPETREGYSIPKKSRYQLKNLTLSAENIIVFGIIFVMILVLFFAFGVERGKRASSLIAVDSDIEKELIRSVKDVHSRNSSVKVKLERRGVMNNVVSSSVSDAAPEIQENDENPVRVIPANLKKNDDASFTVQVASFKLEKNADREAMRLEKIGHEAFILPKGDYFIVCVGRFLQKIEAKEFSSRLKDRYRDCLVRRF